MAANEQQSRLKELITKGREQGLVTQYYPMNIREDSRKSVT